MAANEPVPNPLPINQITTTDLPETPAVAESSRPDKLYPPAGPAPSGTRPESSRNMEAPTDLETKGPGIEGEEVVWEARYSMKNFIGRLVGRTVLTIAWIGLAFYTWEYDGYESLQIVTALLGLGLLLLWAGLIYRIILARYGHYYRLTTRRLFVSTGLMRRRRDQMELLRINDVYTKQTLIGRWLSVGTVVVVSPDPISPMFYLAGVDDPKRVMDLVWHYARAERDNRSVMVDQV